MFQRLSPCSGHKSAHSCLYTGNKVNLLSNMHKIDDINDFFRYSSQKSYPCLLPILCHSIYHGTNAILEPVPNFFRVAQKRENWAKGQVYFLYNKRASMSILSVFSTNYVTKTRRVQEISNRFSIDICRYGGQ